MSSANLFATASWTSIAAVITLMATVLVVWLVVYRLYFHALSKIPGPRLAALTYFYEFYYDGYLDGKFSFQLEKLHDEYGPIIRINPNEVHIQDPDYFDQLYSISSKLNKDPFYYGFLDGPNATFGTDSFSQHRQRRKAFSKYFSPAALNALEFQVQKSVNQLVGRMEGFRDAGKPIKLGNAFRSMARDIVSQYALPEGFHLMEAEDMGEDLNLVDRSLSGFAIWNRHFRWLFPIMNATPLWLMKMVASPGVLQLLRFNTHNMEQSRRIAAGEKGDKKNTILHGIMTSDLPNSEKNAHRLFQESITIVGAGSETAGGTMEILFFFILTQPKIKERLLAELTTAKENGGDLSSKGTLKDLPYLDACWKEALRYGNQITGRLPRHDPVNTIVWREHTFTPGTVVSMTITDMHMNPNCHPDPHAFNPDRWLDPATAKQAEQYFAPFGRGSRACIGRDLAQLEFLITAGTLLSKFQMEIYNTEWDDIRCYHDYFAPFAKATSVGLQVMLK